MNIIDKIHDVKNGIWNINKNVIINKDRSLTNLNTKKIFKYSEDVKRCFYSNNYLFLVRDTDVSILDENFYLLNKINKNGAIGISIFDKANYAIWFENEEDDDDECFDLYSNAELIGKGNFFYGKFLDENYCYRFRKRKDLQNFRLTNLLDTETYFEFNCEDEEEISAEIIKYKDKLIFYTREKEKELYDSKFWINVLDIKTGKIIYKISVQQYGACFDFEIGHFVSIQGINQNNKIIKRYEIVDVNNGKVETDNFDFSQDMFAVGTAVQYINNNKLYFVDNVYSYIEQKRKSPKIGCFDVITKQIIFFEELKETEGFSINQIINNDNMIYVRTDSNELFVLEI